MKIDAIKNGIVIDHIEAGKGMEIYNLLNLGELDCTVALIKNVHSSKMGKKDIIKIDSNIDILDEEALLRAATLVKENDDKLAIYRKAADKFDSQRTRPRRW